MDAFLIIPYLAVAALGIWLYVKAVKNRGPKDRNAHGKKMKLRDCIGWLVCGLFYSFIVGVAFFFVIMAFGPDPFMNLDGRNAERVQAGNSVAIVVSLTIFVGGSLYSTIRAVRIILS